MRLLNQDEEVHIFYFEFCWVQVPDETQDAIELPDLPVTADKLYNVVIRPILQREPLPAVLTFPGTFWWDLHESIREHVVTTLDADYWIGPVTESAIWFLSKESWTS